MQCLGPLGNGRPKSPATLLSIISYLPVDRRQFLSTASTILSPKSWRSGPQLGVPNFELSTRQVLARFQFLEVLQNVVRYQFRPSPISGHLRGPKRWRRKHDCRGPRPQQRRRVFLRKKSEQAQRYAEVEKHLAEPSRQIQNCPVDVSALQSGPLGVGVFLNNSNSAGEECWRSFVRNQTLGNILVAAIFRARVDM